MPKNSELEDLLSEKDLNTQSIILLVKEIISFAKVKQLYRDRLIESIKDELLVLKRISESKELTDIDKNKFKLFINDSIKKYKKLNIKTLNRLLK